MSTFYSPSTLLGTLDSYKFQIYIWNVVVFGWLATSGPCGVLTTGALVLGQRAVASTAAAGAVAPATGVIATYIIEQEIGRVLRVGATGTFSLIDLSIDA